LGSWAAAILIGITHLGMWYKSEDEVQVVPRLEDAADNKSVRRLLNRQTTVWLVVLPTEETTSAFMFLVC